MVPSSESNRYREAAEYDTTVKAARRLAGKVSAGHCLAYEEMQYAAVIAKQVHNPPLPGESPEHLAPEHPDYARRWEEKKAAARARLHSAYESLTQELNDKLAAAVAVPAPDKGILTARRLKASARLLLDSHAEYLTMVTGGELSEKSDLFVRLQIGNAPDNGARKAAAVAAELAHFRRLLVAFDALEGSHPSPAPEAPRPKGPFIEEYRRALDLLKQAHDSPADVVPDTLEADLLSLVQQQNQRIKAAILSDRQTGRGLVFDTLREALEIEAYALATTQQVGIDIDLESRGGYESILDEDVPRAVYYVLLDAISGPLELFGNFFRDEFATETLAVGYNTYSIIELAKQYGPPHLKTLAKQLAPAAAPTTTASAGSNGEPPAAGKLYVREAPHRGELTVEELCCQGFSLPDLTNLLQRLEVVDATGRCLTNDLRGKTRGEKGAFTAAYRTLHRAGLLAATAKDKEWADVLRKQYGANFGAEVVAHRLTATGHAPKSAPDRFQKAVLVANEWISEWKDSRKNTFIAR